MIVETIKDGDRYILPIKGKKKRIKVIIEDEDIEKSETYKLLEKAYEKTKDEFLKMQLTHLPKDFEDKQRDDKEILLEVFKEKYEL